MSHKWPNVLLQTFQILCASIRRKTTLSCHSIFLIIHDLGRRNLDLVVPIAALGICFNFGQILPVSIHIVISQIGDKRAKLNASPFH